MNINIKKLSASAVLPIWNNQSAGADLTSLESVTLIVGHRHLFKTGLSVAIPNGYYGRIAPRSGLAIKNGIDVLAGVLDPDYRGEVGVILINLGEEAVQINVGDKIAQLIIETCHRCSFVEVDDLNNTNRGAGGFGSTDVTPTTTRSAQAEVKKPAPFTLGGRISIDRWAEITRLGTKHSEMVDANWLKRWADQYDGDTYSYTEGNYSGMCIVNADGDVVDKKPLIMIT
jgi:dUTP pyrophosphatase